MNMKKAIPVRISRRHFMKGVSRAFLGGALVTCGTVLPAAKSAADPLRNGDMPMDKFSYSAFSRLVGETFQIQLGGSQHVPAELIEVTRHIGAGSNQKVYKRQDCFSILFRGPLDLPLEQNTYNFAHRRTGAFALFIVPVGIDENGRQYEAVFNRLSA